MNIRESENFPPTLSLDHEGDVLEGIIEDKRFVNTTKGQFPLIELAVVDTFYEEDPDAGVFPKATIWTSRKKLRELNESKYKIGDRIRIVCTSAEGGFKGYGYEITKV